MWLGVLKTAYFAGFKRRHSVPAHFSRSLRSIGTAANTTQKKDTDPINQCP
ncbi:hypothetical protein FD09_GL002014 [Schleiferilactobacillus perolens DSM 12744]|uniref:Uncharacterized protein n=1 Tax=Schleiferilactobacillus perolens DSM 12744 TaxID=1423792 RepID=A0A0R1N8X9_9LACO|nr:hypothetical protein FD09_GL002014 [Schleiferilactobacillus perolens DSM 12744]